MGLLEATSGYAQGRALPLPMETSWTQPAVGQATVSKGKKASKAMNSDADRTTGAVGSQPGARAEVVPRGDKGDAKETATNKAVATDRQAVGVGDQIYVTVFGQPDMSAEVTVNDNEQVTLSLIGTIKVAGLTPPAIENLIAKRLRDGEYLRNPQVSVQVRQVRSQMLSVLGEVARPGRYPITGRMTLLDAVATAGGLGPRADRVVTLLRRAAPDEGEGARQEIPIQLDQIGSEAMRKDLDIEVRNDDVIFVGQQKMFYVYGEVRRPGAYPLEPDLNVMKALSIGGGVTERGSTRRIRIQRTDGNKKLQELRPELTTPVLSGDVVYVDERIF